MRGEPLGKEGVKGEDRLGLQLWKQRAGNSQRHVEVRQTVRENFGTSLALIIWFWHWGRPRGPVKFWMLTIMI